jgi:hypothetical protein
VDLDPLQLVERGLVLDEADVAAIASVPAFSDLISVTWRSASSRRCTMRRA